MILPTASEPVRILTGDCLESMRRLPDECVQACVTSPPYYGLRDYGVAGQLGLEATPDEYIVNMVGVFREVRRVLRNDGTLWLNIGDSYAGYWGEKYAHKPFGEDRTPDGSTPPHKKSPQFKTAGFKPKDMIGIPWMLAFALRADGWYLRQDIIWHKPNPMPESVRDRCTKAHEYLFLLSKSGRYFFDSDAMKEPLAKANSQRTTNRYDTRERYGAKNGGNNGLDGLASRMRSGDATTRNRRDVWSITVRPFKGAHFAVMPKELVRPCVLAGSRAAGSHCDCAELILTPTGNGRIADPSMETGRAGMNRQRRDNEGRRPVTKSQQRHTARELRDSAHRQVMEHASGPAFAHYLRTDSSGARPVPQNLWDDWCGRGWLTVAPPCECERKPGDIIIDPFGGSGTVGLVAAEEGRRSILCELNEKYAEIAHRRIATQFPSTLCEDVAS